MVVQEEVLQSALYVKMLKYIILLLSLTSCSSIKNRKLNEELFEKYDSILIFPMDDSTSKCSTVPYMIRVNNVWTPVELPLSSK